MAYIKVRVFCCDIVQELHESGCIVNGYDNEELLFDASLITSLDWSCHKTTFRGDISPHKPGPNLCMRPLSVDDFDKGMPQYIPTCVFCSLSESSV